MREFCADPVGWWTFYRAHRAAGESRVDASRSATEVTRAVLNALRCRR